MRTPEDRLQHDIESGINRHAAYCMGIGGSRIQSASTIISERSMLRDAILEELRIRWTIIERPRKQKTLRQKS